MERCGAEVLAARVGRPEDVWREDARERYARTNDSSRGIRPMTLPGLSVMIFRYPLHWGLGAAEVVTMKCSSLFALPVIFVSLLGLSTSAHATAFAGVDFAGWSASLQGLYDPNTQQVTP